MRNMVLAALLLAPPQSAFAANVNGNGALALAALIAEYSPLLRAKQKDTMHHLLYAVLAPPPPPEKIVIKTDNIVCRASNVDITEHSCALTFGHRTVNLKGRRAHELYATIDEVGVPPDGAAGSVFEARGIARGGVDGVDLRPLLCERHHLTAAVERGPGPCC